ncbi:MAG: hypothetical protein CVU38_09785 [Chloroflexi bacterium HGW-Chloroflexi-1]|nr:MAG: hypothetical protein CVU38_09785 [Chloroflexi bacterium HGW-Chloroflexi-1]
MGLTAALLLAISPLHLRFSQEVRFYALFVLLTLVSTELLWMAWARATIARWGMYAAVMTLAFYTHYYTALVLGFHATWVVIQWWQEHRAGVARQRGAIARPVGFIAAALIAMVAFAPWIWYAVLREKGPQSFTPPTLNLELVESVLKDYGGRGSVWWPVWGILAILGLLIHSQKRMADTILFGVWTLVPLPVVVLTDIWVHYFFDIRQLLFVLPIYLLLAALGVAAIARGLRTVGGRLSWWRQRLIEIGIIMIVGAGFVGVSLPGIKSYYNQERDDWRGIAQMLHYNTGKQDTIQLFNLEYYVDFYDHEAAARVLPYRSFKQVEEAYASGQPMWLLLTPYLEQHPEAGSIRTWVSQHPGLDFDFGAGMHLHYLQVGRDPAALWPTASRFTLPARPDVLFASRGYTFRAFGDSEDAQDAFVMAAEMTSNSSRRLILLLDAALEAHNRRDSASAFELYSRALKINPDQPAVRLHRAIALLGLGRPAEAVAELDLVLNRYHMDEYWPHRFMGDALRALNRPVEAIPHYSRALELAQDAHDLRYLIAVTYGESGQTGKVRFWLEDYLAWQPDGPLANDAQERIKQLH